MLLLVTAPGCERLSFGTSLNLTPGSVDEELRRADSTLVVLESYNISAKLPSSDLEAVDEDSALPPKSSFSGTLLFTK